LSFTSSKSFKMATKKPRKAGRSLSLPKVDNVYLSAEAERDSDAADEDLGAGNWGEKGKDPKKEAHRLSCSEGKDKRAQKLQARMVGAAPGRRFPLSCVRDTLAPCAEVLHPNG
jgi:hypothetical protein